MDSNGWTEQNETVSTTACKSIAVPCSLSWRGSTLCYTLHSLSLIASWIILSDYIFSSPPHSLSAQKSQGSGWAAWCKKKKNWFESHSLSLQKRRTCSTHSLLMDKHETQLTSRFSQCITLLYTEDQFVFLRQMIKHMLTVKLSL